MKPLRPWFILAVFLFFVGGPLSWTTGKTLKAAESLILPRDPDGMQRGTILLTSYTFSPNLIVIMAGRPVELTLKNDSFLVPHNFVITHETIGLHHEVTVSAGDSVTVQLLLTTPGRYPFYCDKQLLFFPSHREQGMEGVLEVRGEAVR